MEAIATLILIVGSVFLLDARSRVKRLEARLGLLESELRKGTVAVAAEPAAVSVPEPEPVELPPIPQSREAEVPLVRELETAPEPVAAAAMESEPVAVQPPEPIVAPSAPARPSGFSINFEELFGRRLPIWAGGVTLAIAGVLIVKYAIDIGLFGRIFTPWVQVICGLLFGFGLIGGAELAHRNRDRVDDPRVSQALSGAGISTLYAALLVAANAYGLISPLVAFIGLAVVTAMALALSLRHGQPSALLGLAGGLAAPALTVGITANVPMLAVYLSLAIAGMVGVARASRWPWLALAALVGGAGWSLWLILAGEALTVLGALSVGTFVILLAIAAPLFAFEGPRAIVLRTASALVGAAQLALLVAFGGFEPLEWGLFGLIAAAGQWLAWRDDKLAMVPTIGTALSILLLLIWPDPLPGWLLTVGIALAAIHALPLLARLWREPARVQRAVELSAIAVAAPLIALRHFHASWGLHDGVTALTAALGALVLLGAAAMGWKVEARRADRRFACLVATAGGLLAAAAWFAAPHWQAPLFAAAIAAAMLWLARPAGDGRLEIAAAGYALLAVLLLPATVLHFAELGALVDGRVPDIGASSVLRWVGLAAMAVFFVWRAEKPAVRAGSGVAAAGLSYGALAQLLPASALPLVAPLGLLGLAAWGRTGTWLRLRTAAFAAIAILLAWAFVPLVLWLNGAVLSLAGIPMEVDPVDLATGEVLRRLFIPALLLGAGVWLLRDRLSRHEAPGGIVLAAIPGLIALHCFYRIGFSAVFGTDFIATGLAERLLWSGLIIGAGVALWKRTGGLLASHGAPVLVGLGALHVAWYSLLLHDPLWSDQAVGPVALANLILPLFAALPLSVWLLGRMVPTMARYADAALQPVVMVMVALFAWATLRQAFHGSLLTSPGLSETEDILRSILGIVLAVGFLLWGIRSRRRDWRLASLVLMLAAVAKVFVFDASGLEGLLRIASFVALGFSLIGIGWLYSRQLRHQGD